VSGGRRRENSGNDDGQIVSGIMGVPNDGEDTLTNNRIRNYNSWIIRPGEVEESLKTPTKKKGLEGELWQKIGVN
jgi:hypothetical protein